MILNPVFIGIANNGDFQRLMTTVGLDYPYNAWSPENYDKSFWNFVPNPYAYIQPVESSWNQIFAVFPKLAIALSTIAGAQYFDIRFMGFVNAVVYIAAVYVIVRCIMRIDGAWSYVWLALTLWILGDGYILQYLNSFYTEIGSVTGMLLVLGLTLYGFLRGKERKTLWKILLLLGISVSALFAVLSKQQDILVLIPVVAVLCRLMKHLELRILYRIGWAAALIGIVFTLFAGNAAGGDITAFNVTYMDLLRHSEKPEVHLTEMGYSEDEVQRIAERIGGNAFTDPEIYQEFGEDFTRGNEVKILLREPGILLPVVLERSRLLFLDDPNLGNYTADSGEAPREKFTQTQPWYNLKSLFYVSSFWFYIAVIGIAFVLALLAGKISALSAIPKELFWIYGILPVANAARFATVILGDSSHDDYKHFFMTNVEFDIIFVVLICLAVYISIKVVQRKTKKGVEET